MNKIYIINGSPKATKTSNSQYFIDELTKLLDLNNTEIKQASSINFSKEQVYPELLKSDIIIFAAPLYIDCLHASLLTFIIDLEKYIKANNISNINLPKVYVIFNCGFFEGHQNRIALDIIRNFCNKIGFTWRFGVGIGAGEFMGGSKDIPLNSKPKIDTYNAFMEIKKDIENNSTESKSNIFTSPKMPRFLFQLVGGFGWIKQAKSNNIKIRNIYAKVYTK